MDFARFWYHLSERATVGNKEGNGRKPTRKKTSQQRGGGHGRKILAASNLGTEIFENGRLVRGERTGVVWLGQGRNLATK